MPVGTCPEHLSQAAKEEWNRLTVENKDILTPADYTALVAYCTAYARWTEAESKIFELGAVVRVKDSNKHIQNPYVAVAHKALDTMRDFLMLLQHRAARTTTVF